MHAHTQHHSGVKSHPALSTGAAGLRLNMCCRARCRDDRASITTAYCRFHAPCFPGLQPSQVLWLITPATEQQENCTFWQEQPLTKESFLRGNMSHLCPPWEAHHHHDINPHSEKSHIHSAFDETLEWLLWQKSSHFSHELCVTILLWAVVFCVTGCIFSDVVFITSLHNFFGIYLTQCHLAVHVGSQFAVVNLWIYAGLCA